MVLPRIAITMGDPAGVGPEICLRTLIKPAMLSTCVPVVVGDADVLRAVGRQLDLPLSDQVRVASPSEWNRIWREVRQPTIVDLRAMEFGALIPGSVDKATGAASYQYILFAIDAALAGQVEAVTTGPIHKEAIHAAGVPYPGHTEMFAEKTAARRHCMMLTSNELTCSFVTGHVGFRDVLDLLDAERILDVIELSDAAMRRIRGRRPKLVACGLNPHGGEHGLFGGGEEERIIAPALAAARRRGVDVEGPLPPDTAFLPWRRRETDCFICMYHDQGLIPLKALAFDTAVNVTLGLPIVRTSVDHGTACDIAWQGKADYTSLFHAVNLAARLCRETDAASLAVPHKFKSW